VRTAYTAAPMHRRAASAAALLFLCASPISHSASHSDPALLSHERCFPGATAAPPRAILPPGSPGGTVRLRGGRPHSEVDAGPDGEAAWSAAAESSATYLPHHDLLWKQDVGERYKLLVPPRHVARQGTASGALKAVSAKQMRDAVAKASLSSPPLPGKCIDEVVMFVDLDKAAIFGNDGNDFGIALQWMEKPYSDVVELYKLLLNPNLRETYQTLAAHAHKVKVVIYTMRASYLVYQSCFRDDSPMLPLRWNASWHIEGQLHLPSRLATSEQVARMCCWCIPPPACCARARARARARASLIRAPRCLAAFGLRRAVCVVRTARPSSCRPCVHHAEQRSLLVARQMRD